MEEREGGNERIGEAKSSRMDKEYSLGRLGRGRRKSRPIVREVIEGGREVVGWWKKLPKAREVRGREFEVEAATEGEGGERVRKGVHASVE